MVRYAETLGFEREDYRELFEAVMGLEKKYRVPLILYYYEGHSTSEIASILRLPENTISTRLFRARAKKYQNSYALSPNKYVSSKEFN